MIWISDLRDASQRYSKIHSVGEVFTMNAIKNTFLLFDVSYSLIDSFLFWRTLEECQKLFYFDRFSKKWCEQCESSYITPGITPNITPFSKPKIMPLQHSYR